MRETTRASLLDSSIPTDLPEALQGETPSIRSKFLKYLVLLDSVLLCSLSYAAVSGSLANSSVYLVLILLFSTFFNFCRANKRKDKVILVLLIISASYSTVYTVACISVHLISKKSTLVLPSFLSYFDIFTAQQSEGYLPYFMYSQLLVLATSVCFIILYFYIDHGSFYRCKASLLRSLSPLIRLVALASHALIISFLTQVVFVHVHVIFSIILALVLFGSDSQKVMSAFIWVTNALSLLTLHVMYQLKYPTVILILLISINAATTGLYIGGSCFITSRCSYEKYLGLLVRIIIPTTAFLYGGFVNTWLSCTAVLIGILPSFTPKASKFSALLLIPLVAGVQLVSPTKYIYLFLSLIVSTVLIARVDCSLEQNPLWIVVSKWIGAFSIYLPLPLASVIFISTPSLLNGIVPAVIFLVHLVRLNNKVGTSISLLAASSVLIVQKVSEILGKDFGGSTNILVLVATCMTNTYFTSSMPLFTNDYIYVLLSLASFTFARVSWISFASILVLVAFIFCGHKNGPLRKTIIVAGLLFSSVLLLSSTAFCHLAIIRLIPVGPVRECLGVPESYPYPVAIFNSLIVTFISLSITLTPSIVLPFTVHAVSYILWIVAFFSLRSSPTFISSLLFLSLSIQRFFGKVSPPFGYVIMVVYIIFIVFSIYPLDSLIPHKIGLDLTKPIDRFLSSLVLVSLRLYILNPPPSTRRYDNLSFFVILGICFTALSRFNIIGVLASVFIIFVILYPSFTKRAAQVTYFPMLSLLIYQSVINFLKLHDTYWMNFFLLSGKNDATFIPNFFVIVSLTFMIEYGSDGNEGFGETFITAHLEQIALAIITPLNILMNDPFSLVHFLALFLFGQRAALYACTITICLHSLGFIHAPYMWAVIATVEVYYNICLKAKSAVDVAARQKLRTEYREKREEILNEIQEVDKVYADVYFERGTDSLEAIEKKIVQGSNNNRGFWKGIAALLVRPAVWMCDLSREPGLSVPLLQRILGFMKDYVNRYKETGEAPTLDVDAARAARSHIVESSSLSNLNEEDGTIKYDDLHLIPASFDYRFAFFHNLKIPREPETTQFKRYFLLSLLRLPSILLMVVSVLFPVIYPSFLSILLFIMYALSLSLSPRFLKWLFYSSMFHATLLLFKELPVMFHFFEAFRLSVSELQRRVPLYPLLGLSANVTFPVLIAILCLYSFNNFPKPFVMYHNLPYSSMSAALDLISAIIIVFAFPKSSSLLNPSTFTPEFISLLGSSIALAVAVQILVMSSMNLAALVCSILSYLITYASFLPHVPFYVTLIRALSIICMSMHTSSPPVRKPPSISMKRPLSTYVSSFLSLSVPYWLELSSTVKWVSYKTSIALTDFLVLEELRERLLERTASKKLFPETDKPPSRTVGIVLLAVLLLLILAPALFLMSSSKTATPNPAVAGQLRISLSGLPDLIIASTPFTPNPLTKKEQQAMLNYGDYSLENFYAGPAASTQKVEFPSFSDAEWKPSQTAIDAVKGANHVTAMADIEFTFIGGESRIISGTPVILINESLDGLKQVLNESQGTFNITHLIPLFHSVDMGGSAASVGSISLNVSLTLAEGSWTAYADPVEEFPGFSSSERKIKVILWSEASPDRVTKAVLSSTGGVIGLYAFVVITIGQFIRNAVFKMSEMLWISRMERPEKILAAILHMEGRRMVGDLAGEKKSAEDLLDVMRTRERLISLGQDL